MPAPADYLISEDEERSLHRRLVDRDVTASTDLARLFLDHLIAWLVEKNSSRVPEELCIEAAEDALIALMKSPASFNPARGKRLAAYLRMSARGDLRNILQRERRHRDKHILLEDVELFPEAGKYLVADDDPLRSLERQEESAKATRTVVAPVREGLSEGESRVLDLILQGERKTAVFAEALGITHLPTNAQRTEVKRVKDKLKKRIERETSGDGKPS
jgi:RNA polymerase sigma-70 factor (ECF subfamily)